MSDLPTIPTTADLQATGCCPEAAAENPSVSTITWPPLAPGTPTPVIKISGQTLPVIYGTSMDGTVLWGAYLPSAMFQAIPAGAGEWITSAGAATVLANNGGGANPALGCSRDGTIGVGGDPAAAFWAKSGAVTNLADPVTTGKLAYGVTDDGVIVGSGHDASDNPQAYYWTTAAPGTIAQLSNSGHATAGAYGISRDGQLVVGWVSGASGNPATPAYWAGLSAAPVTLPLLAGMTSGIAYRCAGSGNLIVGSCTAAGQPQPCSWSAPGNETVTALSLTAGATTYAGGEAVDCSDDGSVIGGRVIDGSNVWWPAVWTNAGATLQIPPTNGQTASTDINGFVAAISGDGKTLAGGQGIASNGNTLQGIVWSFT